MRVWTLSASSTVRRIAKVFLSFNLTLCTLILLLSVFSSNPLFFFLCDSNTPATASSVWALICCWWLAQDPVGSIFFQLVRLDFRGCDDNWSNLLMHVLRHSPVLQTLNFVVLDYGLVYFQSLPKRVKNYMSALRFSLMHCISTSSFITEQLESWARCQGSLDSAELCSRMFVVPSQNLWVERVQWNRRWETSGSLYTEEREVISDRNCLPWFTHAEQMSGV